MGDGGEGLKFDVTTRSDVTKVWWNVSWAETERVNMGLGMGSQIGEEGLDG